MVKTSVLKKIKNLHQSGFLMDLLNDVMRKKNVERLRGAPMVGFKKLATVEEGIFFHMH